jgi:hypothetical protein
MPSSSLASKGMRVVHVCALGSGGRCKGLPLMQRALTCGSECRRVRLCFELECELFTQVCDAECGYRARFLGEDSGWHAAQQQEEGRVRERSWRTSPVLVGHQVRALQPTQPLPKLGVSLSSTRARMRSTRFHPPAHYVLQV